MLAFKLSGPKSATSSNSCSAKSRCPCLLDLLVGMFLAVGASYLLRGVLHGLNTVDGVSFAGVSLLFLAIALFAAWLPSRQAMRVDPMMAIRYE